MSTLVLRILYFEDLTVGMAKTLSKTIASSDVVGFVLPAVLGTRFPGSGAVYSAFHEFELRAPFQCAPVGHLHRLNRVKSSQAGTFSPNFDLSLTIFPLGNMVTYHE
jgi:hypothetical protein